MIKALRYPLLFTAFLVTALAMLLSVSRAHAQPGHEAHLIVAPSKVPCGKECSGLQALRERFNVVGIATVGNDLVVQNADTMLKLAIPALSQKSREKIRVESQWRFPRPDDLDQRLSGVANHTEIETDNAVPGSIAVAKNGDIIWGCLRYKAILRTKRTDAGYGATDLVLSDVEPGHLAIGDDDTIYVSDTQRDIVLAIRNGKATRILGTGTAGSSPDGTPATDAKIDSPGGLAVLRSGRLIVVTLDGIKTISPGGTIETLGAGGNTVPGHSPIPLHEARLEGPTSVSIAGDDVYILDHPDAGEKSELLSKAIDYRDQRRMGKSLREYETLRPDRIYKISLSNDTIEEVPTQTGHPIIKQMAARADGTLFCTHLGPFTTMEDFINQSIVAYSPVKANATQSSEDNSKDSRSLDELLGSLGLESPAKKNNGDQKRPTKKKGGKDLSATKGKVAKEPKARESEKDSSRDKGKQKLPQPDVAALEDKPETQIKQSGSSDSDYADADWTTVKERAPSGVSKQASCCDSPASGSSPARAIIDKLETANTHSTTLPPIDDDQIHRLLSQWLAEQDEQSGWKRIWDDHIKPRHGTLQSAMQWQRVFGEPKSAFTLTNPDDPRLSPAAQKSPAAEKKTVRDLIRRLVATKHQPDANVLRTAISFVKEKSHWRIILRGHFKHPIGKTDLTNIDGKIDGYPARHLAAVFALTPNGIQPITAYPF